MLFRFFSYISGMNIDSDIFKIQSNNVLPSRGKILISEPFLRDATFGRSLFYLHTLSDIPGSISISKGLYLNGDFDEIKKYILQGNKISECIRFFLGYSGWDSEQLSNEIRENTWLVSEEEKSYLMKNNIKDMWRKALEKLGSKYETWSRFPQVPTLN